MVTLDANRYQVIIGLAWSRKNAHERTSVQPEQYETLPPQQGHLKTLSSCWTRSSPRRCVYRFNICIDLCPEIAATC